MKEVWIWLEGSSSSVSARDLAPLRPNRRETIKKVEKGMWEVLEDDQLVTKPTRRCVIAEERSPILATNANDYMYFL
jgi:hypothetical protein